MSKLDTVAFVGIIVGYMSVSTCRLAALVQRALSAFLEAHGLCCIRGVTVQHEYTAVYEKSINEEMI